MSSTPQPLFDMSKAIPLTPQEHPLFDMSKAQPIQTADAQEPEQGFWRGSPSIPGQAIQESLGLSPEKMKEGAVTAGKTALAGAAAGSAAIGAGAALAPTVGTELVGTGVLDATGEEIMREGVKYGPSAIARTLAHPLGKEILAWALRGGASAIGGEAVWKGLKALGVF